MTSPLPNEQDVHPNFRLGWRGPTKRAVLDFAPFLTYVGLTYPASVDYMSNVQEWNGRTNRKFGTCGPNSVANLFVMWFMYALGEQVTVSDEAIYSLYRRSGNPNFSPDTGQGDGGVDTSIMLSEMQNGGGLDITRANGTVENHKIAVFGKLTGQGPNLVDQIRYSTALFGGVILGVMLEIAQQAQTRAQPPVWTDIPSSGNWGGHDIFGGRYTSEEADDEQVISWLVKVGISDGFLRARTMECFVAIPDIALKSKPIAEGVDWQGLADAFYSITGRPLDISQVQNIS